MDFASSPRSLEAALGDMRLRCASAQLANEKLHGATTHHTPVSETTQRGSRGDDEAFTLRFDRLSKCLTAVGFDPSQLAPVGLDSTPLGHSGKLPLSLNESEL